MAARTVPRHALTGIAGGTRGLANLRGTVPRYPFEVRGRQLAITQHMPTLTLRAPEAGGLVRQAAFAEVPPRVEYSLIKRGFSLGVVFAMLRYRAKMHPR